MKRPGRDFDYFSALRRLGQQAGEAGAVLNRLLAAYSREKAGQALEDIHGLSQKGAALRHELMKRLAHDFLPPLEREDLALLAREAGMVLEALEGAARCLCQYPFEPLPPGAADLGPLLFLACREWQAGLAALSRFREECGIRKRVSGISRLKRDADSLLLQAGQKLYANSPRPLALAAGSALLASLAQCFISCRDALEYLEVAVIKNR